jgi:hypothetical protein
MQAFSLKYNNSLIKMTKILAFSIAFMLTGVLSFAQLSGIKTIPGDYATVAAAIADLNTNGVGPDSVVFKIAAGHNETFASATSGRITTLAGSATSQIIFRKDGAGENPTITSAAGTGTMDAIISIAGGDYITIDGLKLIESGGNNNETTMFEWGIAILKASESNGAQHITIKNCAISLNKSYIESKAIYANNHTTANTTQLQVNATSGTNSNLKIFSNTISNCYSGIYIHGHNATSPFIYYDQNNQIGKDGGNTITNVGAESTDAYGIYTKYQNNVKVANNHITSNSGSEEFYGDVYGICMLNASNASYDCYGNYISIQFNGNGYNAYLYGIYCNMGENGSNNVANIYDNTVTGCTFPSALYAEINCIYLSGMGETANVYGNKVMNNTFGASVNAVTSVIRYLYMQKASSIDGPLNVHHNVVKNNVKLDNGSGANSTYFIGILGSGTTLDCYNDTVMNNNVNSRHVTHCLYVTFNDNTYKRIHHNYISGITNVNSTSYGIYNANGTLALIYNNIIREFSSSIPGTNFMVGINHSTYCQAAYYYNNMISDLDNRVSLSSEGLDYTTLAGFNVEAEAAGVTSRKGFYNNTVFLNSPSTTVTFGSAAFFTFSLYGIDLRNNIFVNISTNSGTNGKTLGIRVRSQGFSSFTSNYNCIYAGTPGPANLIYADPVSSYQTLLNYKTIVTPQELQSVTELPPFVNIAVKPYDIHLQNSTATQCEAGGISVSNPISIPEDIDNEKRYPYPGFPVNPSYPPNAPDIGTDEIGGISNDLTAPAIIYTPLGNTAGTGARTLAAQITDGTGVPVTGTGLPRLYWKKNAGSYTGVTAVHQGGGIYIFTFGSGVSLGDVISYYVAAQDTRTPTPNVSSYPWIGASGFTYSPPACSTPPSAPSSYTIVAGISGTFHVGVGKTYTTLTAAINDINNRGITGPITLLLDDNNYPSETYPIIFNPNSGSNATNKLTIKPNPGAVPVFNGSANGQGLLMFKGMDHVIIDGSNSGGTDKSLTFINSSSSSGACVIGITNNGVDGSSYISLQNCIFKGDNSNLSTETYVIVFNQNGGIDGGRYSNILIENNTIMKAKNGIWVHATPSNRNFKVQILNNIIGSPSSADYINRWGIVVQQSDSTLIAGNDIMGPAEANILESQFGILFYDDCINTRITGNLIHDFKIQGRFSVGIRCSNNNTDTPTEISNNVIYNLGCYGLNPGISQNNPYGIFIRNGGNIRIWNNSIYLRGPYLSGNDSYAPSSACIGFYNYATGPFDVRNNILRNSMTNPIPNPSPDAIGKAYGIMVANGPEIFEQIDNNLYFIDGHNGQIAQFFSQVIGLIDFPTVESWQAYTGDEENSFSEDPLFTSTTDLKLLPGSPAVGLAVPIPQITTDLDGNPRHPDYPSGGAYEYAPPLNLTWTGLVSNNWNTGGNWSPVALPKYFTQALIPSIPAGGLIFPVVPDTGYPLSVKKLDIETGATMTLQAGSTLNVVNN